MAALTWFDAPAKINLALHVTGRRADGYHLIETIAVFAVFGDRIGIQDSPADAFHLAGPEAAALLTEDPATNLVVRARDMLRSILAARGRNALPVAITLDKRLPAGSGIGGGSADAAATLRALTGHWSAGDLAGTI
ncbi:MAG: 4-(cytidine 5'-diphospho)-2-C-methyl-D-erythritol kinase, partial [Oricola sp.]